MSAHTTGPEGTRAYEERDVSFRPILATTAVLIALIVFTGVFVHVFQAALLRREAATSPPASPLAASYGPTEPPAPRLQAHPRSDLEALRERERAVLEGYGWIDRAAGRARIPVERAMALLVAEGRS